MRSCDVVDVDVSNRRKVADQAPAVKAEHRHVSLPFCICKIESELSEWMKFGTFCMTTGGFGFFTIKAFRTGR